MTPTDWLKTATALIGPLPTSYVTLDTETTGLSFSEDLVVQVGWTVVVDRVLKARGSALLNWYAKADRDMQLWLDRQLARVKEQVEFRNGFITGNQYAFTPDRLRREGQDPAETLSQLYSLLREAAAAGFAFVGHRAALFDWPMLSGLTAEFVGESPPPLTSDGYLDTMAIEKAVQTLPAFVQGEGWREFSRRGCYLGGNKIRAALSGYCAHKYDLVTKHGLDMSQAHDAGFDAVLTHYLFETFLDMAESHV